MQKQAWAAESAKLSYYVYENVVSFISDLKSSKEHCPRFWDPWRDLSEDQKLEKCSSV